VFYLQLKYIAIILCTLISLGNLKFVKDDKKNLAGFTKFFLMPSLIFVYLSCSHYPNLLIVAALFFGFLGDIFLEIEGKLMVLGGITFFIGHIFYIEAFINNINFQNIPNWIYLLIIPYFLYASFILIEFYPYLKSLVIYIFIYMVALLAMSYCSLLRCLEVTGYRFYFPFIGSVLFVLSDSLIGFNTLKGKIKNGQFYIMATYILAQLFITIGFI
jgi:Predicted membrane protein